MNIRELRLQLGDTQKEFSERYHIPFRTIQNWETGVRTPPEYITELLKDRIMDDMINRRTIVLPKYSPAKYNLPKRSEYIGTYSWLKAVEDCLGEDVVFALDQALMCQGNFCGHSDEFLVWVYGNDSLSGFNGVVVLGNYISPYYVKNKGGLKFTDFNRTLSDAFANESILDMQGIIESLSKYYYSNGYSYDGLYIPPNYQERFNIIAKEAIEYYEN